MEEPHVLLRWATFHFAGGDAYLASLLLMMIGQIGLLTIHAPEGRRWMTNACGFALIWGSIDPAPLPHWLMAVWIALAIAWLVRLCRFWVKGGQPLPILRQNRCLQLATIGAALVALSIELPTLWIQDAGEPITSIGVVGDSISAGLTDGELTWPQRLSRDVSTQVWDASQPGATLKSAAAQVTLIQQHSVDLLLLEIGGNDLLEGLPLDQFERNLDHLLAIASKPSQHKTVMLELPLPPIMMRYGAVQRRLARTYHASLVHRRYFASILTEAGATVDGIHLTRQGHERMKDLIVRLFKFPSSPNRGQYGRLELK